MSTHELYHPHDAGCDQRLARGLSPAPLTRERSRTARLRLRWTGNARLVLLAACALVGLSATPASAQIISNTFEDGTTQGWNPRGSVTLSASTEAARTGTHSLKTSGRTATWNGPARDLRGQLSANTTYQISGWVRLVAGQPASNLKFTVEMRATGATSNTYVQVNAPVAVTDAAWVQLQGTFSFTAATNDVLTLYLESDAADAAYYLDDFTITGPPAPPPAGTVVAHGFETSTENWSARGPVTLESSADVARTGSRSLKTSGRTSTWNGPALDLRSLLSANTTYQISGWVRLVAGQTPSNLKFTVEMRPTGATSNTYVQVNPATAVTDAGWVQLQGTFSFTSASNDNLTLYLESDNATAAYYLDDFTITGPGDTEEPPPDTTGLETKFESGTTEGWGPRGGVTVATTTEAAATGTYSLKTTGRTASWQGPSINVLGKLSKGHRYAIGVRVKLLPGEPASDVRVSLQATFNGATTFHTVIGNTPVTDAAWVDLSTIYTFGIDATQLQLYVETASGSASFYIDDFMLDFIEPPTIQPLPPVKDEFTGQFDVGAAIEPAELTGSHRTLLLRHFNMIVAGNAMKWSSLQPTEGNFNWGPADAIANFARDHDLKLRGHTLIWHNQTPAWVFRDAAGNPLQAGNAAHRELLIQRIRTHINAVVNRYKDVVVDWDVVNEVIDASAPNGLRNSAWLQIIGPDYIDLAFQMAAEALGGAPGRLVINDYNTHEPAKRDAMAAVVRGLQSRGVRVDAAGHQTHIRITWPPLAEIAQSIDAFTALGLDNQITELDVSVYSNDTDTAPATQETLVAQAYRYRDLFNLFRAKADQISSVTLWGLADDGTWLKTFPIARDDKPLLFDEQLQAKPAYYGVVDPSQLPIVPQILNVTQKPARGVINNLEAWVAIAPVLLDSDDGSAAWGQFRMLWSPDRLHLAVEVTDATRLRDGDAVEIFLPDGKVYEFSRLGLERPSGAQGLTLPTRDGYVVFATVPAPSELSVGDELAFDLRVTDGATGRKQSWSNTRHTQEDDESAFGTLNLLPEKLVVQVTRGTPTIDGTQDRAWHMATEIVTNRFVLGSSGATARVKLLWGAGHLYLYATISDPVLSKTSPNPWEEDSVEIFVDADNVQSMTYDGDDAQYRVNFDNEVSVGGSSSAANVTSATRRVDGGYVVEAAIKIPEGETVRGSVLGFDFQVNDDAGSGTRTSVATWNDLSGNAYLDPSQFGAIVLR